MTTNDFLVSPPTLDRLDITVQLDGAWPKRTALVAVQASCARRRGTIWHHQETLPADRGDYSAVDFVNHLLLVALQEAPSSQAVFDREMVGQQALF